LRDPQVGRAKPLSVSRPDLNQAPERFEGEGRRCKVKQRETETQVDMGVAERGISFFIILKLQMEST
jgi:hypothetical protein